MQRKHGSAPHAHHGKGAPKVHHSDHHHNGKLVSGGQSRARKTKTSALKGMKHLTEDTLI
jgi:hypothetical protein